MYKVYLSLGTNLGNRKRNIREAIDKIGEQTGAILLPMTSSIPA